MSRKLSNVFSAYAWIRAGVWSQLAAQQAEQAFLEVAEIARELGESARSSAALLEAARTGRIR